MRAATRATRDSEGGAAMSGEVKNRFNPVFVEEENAGGRAVQEEIEEDEEEFYQSPESRDYFDEFGRAALRMDTIYESFEEFVDSSDERSSTEGTSSARVSADSPTSVLRRSIRAWCEATGLPTTVLVETKDRSFRLHKLPLVSRSGHFKRALSTSIHVRLTESFPGGSDTFELIASFCYDSAIHIDSENVATLRCCAQYLEMTEEFGKENLIARAESYLTQVVFCSWVDTLLVLHQCEKLLPVSNELLIVTRCVHSLVDVACAELHKLFLAGDSLGSSESNVVKDLLELPFCFFNKLIAALRKQKLEEEMASQLIMMYVKRHLFNTDLNHISDALNEAAGDGEARRKKVRLLEGVVKLLPVERFAMPLRFLFSLHGCALAWGASGECRAGLEASIASQLELATIEDLLVSVKASGAGSWAMNIDSMHRIASLFISEQKIILDSTEILLADHELKTASSYSSLGVSAVAKVWDEYLTEIANDPELNPRKFMELSEVIPTHVRVSHDQLYKAIHKYLKSHPALSQADRFVVCRGLNCQKLSREVCMHAVQNEQMPLRMIVQAMFMHQLQAPGSDQGTTSTNAGSTSFHRRTLTADCQTFEQVAMTPQQQHQHQQQDDGLPLGLILQRDAAFREAAFLKDDFEATKSRLRELEQELVRLKRTMHEAEGSSKTNSSSRRSKFGGSCMYWRAQASGMGLGRRISKTLHKLGVMGSFWKSSGSGSQGPDCRDSRAQGQQGNEPDQRRHGTPDSRAREKVNERRAPQLNHFTRGELMNSLTEKPQVFNGSGHNTPARSNSFRRAETESTRTESMNKTRHSRHRSFS